MLAEPVIVSHFAVCWYNRQECTVIKKEKRKERETYKENREGIKKKWKKINLHIFSYMLYVALQQFRILYWSRFVIPNLVQSSCHVMMTGCS
jgi:hypothetical protein